MGVNRAIREIPESSERSLFAALALLKNCLSPRGCSRSETEPRARLRCEPKYVTQIDFAVTTVADEHSAAEDSWNAAADLDAHRPITILPGRLIVLPCSHRKAAFSTYAYTSLPDEDKSSA